MVFIGFDCYESFVQVDLLTDFLPQFFLAQGKQLRQAAFAALSLLELEGTSAYMIVRDETVFARSYNLIYGLNRRLI
jgi:hypothetical protein